MAVDVPRTTKGPGLAIGRDLVVVDGFRSAIAADFAEFVGRGSRSEAVLVDDESGSMPDDRAGQEPASLILFLPPSLSDSDHRRLADLLKAASRGPIRFVGIVSTFRVHLEDQAAEEAERLAISLVRSVGIDARVVLFRPGPVLSPNSSASRWLRRLAAFFPLAPSYLRACFIEGQEFFEAIETERSGTDPIGVESLNRRYRAYTFLGANLSWREILERHRDPSRGRIATAVAHLGSWLLLGHLVALVVKILAKRVSWAKSWSVHTLKPRSLRELVSLCHRRNIDRVRVVGYNNGVNHFGHRYPGKTIVSTSRCRRTVKGGPGTLKAECGATIRDAKDYLGKRGEELYVVPNYSYVALGTAFFVPIHGSAIDYSTVADTALRVILYDPDRDRIVSASRDEEAFRENVYNPRSRAVVLVLYLRTKPKSSYFIRSEIRKSPEAAELLAALRDRDAANVEIRQGHAASVNVTISKYYTSVEGMSGTALESPRDTLGRLWDQLEENPISSFLMHALSRHLAWHTELFFNQEEFELFWRTHAQVPLRKIQLRYIRRDGMPHSPFRDEDCVSADLFLFRTDKHAFDTYIGRTFGSVRTNPGKHSN